ncbi:hypothetical protein C2E23DRAFT_822722 [Lenzites betulinus]|nr:hypothetical protein C2E23DRAFT_822722 [Lenzites betulinus]
MVNASGRCAVVSVTSRPPPKVRLRHSTSALKMQVAGTTRRTSRISGNSLLRHHPSVQRVLVRISLAQ